MNKPIKNVNVKPKVKVLLQEVVPVQRHGHHHQEVPLVQKVHQAKAAAVVLVHPVADPVHLVVALLLPAIALARQAAVQAVLVVVRELQARALEVPALGLEVQEVVRELLQVKELRAVVPALQVAVQEHPAVGLQPPKAMLLHQKAELLPVVQRGDVVLHVVLDQEVLLPVALPRREDWLPPVKEPEKKFLVKAVKLHAALDAVLAVAVHRLEEARHLQGDAQPEVASKKGINNRQERPISYAFIGLFSY
jgi:hypothetical protein